MKSTDAVVASIDAALNDFDVSDDAMRCTYNDELPPVEDRGGPYDSGFEVSYGSSDVQFWIYDEAAPDGQPAGEAAVLPTGWRDIGWFTDTPDAFGREVVTRTAVSRPRPSGASATVEVYHHAVFMSLLLYGDVFVERGRDGYPRVMRPMEVSRPDGSTVYEPLRQRLERDLGVPVTDQQAAFVAAWESSGDPATDRARIREDLRSSSRVVSLQHNGYHIPLATVDEHILGVSASSGGIIKLITKDEMRPRIPQPVEPEGPVGIRASALNARRTRSTGPTQNPHRHRGLRR